MPNFALAKPIVVSTTILKHIIMKKNFISASANVFDVIAMCKNIVANKFGYGFIAKSEPKFKAPKKTASEWQAVFGTEMPNIIKITRVLNARCYDYEKAINRKLTADGKESDFKADGLNGYEWIVYPIIKKSLKTNTLQLTVTFKSNDKTTFETKYLVGGEIANEEQDSFIREHLYVAPQSAKQAAYGISEEDQIKVRNYKLDNVIVIGKANAIKSDWAEI